MAGTDRWQRVGALFDRALATPPPERAGVIGNSGEPADVQDEVRALLTSHAESEGFLERRRCSSRAPRSAPIASIASSGAAAWAWSTWPTTRACTGRWR